MAIYTLNPDVIADGERAFADSIRQYLGSSSVERQTGMEVIPGAIYAAIRAGISDEEDIRNVVGRVSRSNGPKVAKVLHGLSDPRIAGRLWSHVRDDSISRGDPASRRLPSSSNEDMRH